MNRGEALDRRVEVSAEISNQVYKYEGSFTKALNKGQSTKDAKQSAETNFWKKIGDNSNLQLVDSMYDPTTGVAAVAVTDKQTGETYLTYAGTNYDADGMKDVKADVSIAFNNPLYLKVVADSAVEFYEKVEKTGANITVTTGHSYGDFLDTRVAIEKQVPYKFGYQGAPQSAAENNIYKSKYASTALELLNDLTQSHLEVDGCIKDSEKEEKRVKNLIDNYKGYAVTFSTTRDALTNALWEQSETEIGFDGKVYNDGSDLDWGAKASVKVLSDLYDTNVAPAYVGQVIAIDRPIEHSMSVYLKDEQTMALYKANRL